MMVMMRGYFDSRQPRPGHTGSTGAKNDYFPLVHTPLGGEVVSTPQALDASFVPSGGSDVAGIRFAG